MKTFFVNSTCILIWLNASMKLKMFYDSGFCPSGLFLLSQSLKSLESFCSHLSKNSFVASENNQLMIKKTKSYFSTKSFNQGRNVGFFHVSYFYFFFVVMRDPFSENLADSVNVQFLKLKQKGYNLDFWNCETGWVENNSLKVNDAIHHCIIGTHDIHFII